MLPLEHAYGFVAVTREGAVDRFLLVCQKSGWSFPKGHIEEGEVPLEAARRELLEETGISDAVVIPGHSFEEEYTFLRRDVPTQKINTYFLAIVHSSDKVRPQPDEILECRFATFEEALKLFQSESRKRVLGEAKNALALIPRV